MADKAIWEQLDDEPVRWFRRFETFRLLPDRSVLAAYNHWLTVRNSPRKSARNSPPTWRDAASRWRWHERAEAWDKHCLELAAATVEARRIQILTSGYALKHERVRALDELAKLLIGETVVDDKRWVPDVKSIGSGEFAERVDIVRFNAGLIEQARKTLDDIAAEMGERVVKHELSGSLRQQTSSVQIFIPDNGRKDRDPSPTGTTD